MKYKRILIIVCAIFFFLGGLTSYLNRIIFPRLIKKIAIERIEIALNRKVEIGSIRFNWIKGFIINHIKIYDKGSSGAVFAQADQASFGIIFLPGFKQYRITIPFINVRSPSIHLIRTSDDIWNFSDILDHLQPATTSTATGVKTASPPAFEIAWGGITITDGKVLMNDISHGRRWSEFFDNINVKLSLSYNGIHYDFTADIPGKKGLVGATVYYQPITKNTRAQIHLKNIDTASYFSLINLPDVQLKSGIIQEINLNINYSQDKTLAEGDVIMKNLDITSQDQNFKGDIEIRHLDARYDQGDINARGQMTLNNIHTSVPGLVTDGSIQTKVNDFELTKETMTFVGSLNAQNIFLNLKNHQAHVDQAVLDNIKIRKDKDGLQAVGSINTQGLIFQWPNQKLQGDIALKDMTLRMKDPDNISLEGMLQADHLRLEFEKNMLTCDSLLTDTLSFNLEDDIVKITSTLNASKAKLILNNTKTMEADPHLELALHMPLNDPQKLTYKGSVTFSNGHIQGFAPLPSIDNIELDTDFQTDEATINALSVNILDTPFHLTGTVNDFKNPFLNITANADGLNLAKIKDLVPQVLNQYGLTFTGTSSLDLEFKGLAFDPLGAAIEATASVNNASIASSKFHQSIKNISGIVEVSPDSLNWHHFTATYLAKKYTSVGSIVNFKSPKILATLDGPLTHLNADIIKDNDIITINSITGKYLNADFISKGTIALSNRKGPVFDINTKASMLLENIVPELPLTQREGIEPLHPTGPMEVSAELKSNSFDWKNYTLNATITSPIVSLMGYKLTDMKISIDGQNGKIKNATLDGNLYGGSVHAIASMDLSGQGMPYDLALNINTTDLHLLKMDSPLKMQEIDGKFYSTLIAHGTIANFKNNLNATGSVAIKEGYLGEFNIFKGLLSVLNDALNLGQVMITDVEGNFTISDQKINTDDFRLKGPTIALLAKGWVNFDQICNLNVTVDLSSGIVPAIAHDVLKTLNIRIYDKIDNPKFKKRISVPQVINSLLKNLF